MIVCISLKYFYYLDLLDEWSCMMPKLKELLSNTGKMPLRVCTRIFFLFHFGTYIIHSDTSLNIEMC
jgi:hypothetical protein